MNRRNPFKHLVSTLSSPRELTDTDLSGVSGGDQDSQDAFGDRPAAGIVANQEAHGGTGWASTALSQARGDSSESSTAPMKIRRKTAVRQETAGRPRLATARL